MERPLETARTHRQVNTRCPDSLSDIVLDRSRLIDRVFESIAVARLTHRVCGVYCLFTAKPSGLL